MGSFEYQIPLAYADGGDSVVVVYGYPGGIRTRLLLLAEAEADDEAEVVVDIDDQLGVSYRC